MKANELRIGNWVQDFETDEKYFQVEQLCKYVGYDIWAVYRNGSIKTKSPEFIPITPEVLEKCGFVPNAIGQLAIEVLGIDTHLELITINDGYCYVNLNQVNEFGNSQNVAINRIQYLHQLQNLYFALTGEELIYKP